MTPKERQDLKYIIGIAALGLIALIILSCSNILERLVAFFIHFAVVKRRGRRRTAVEPLTTFALDHLQMVEPEADAFLLVYVQANGTTLARTNCPDHTSSGTKISSRLASTTPGLFFDHGWMKTSPL